MPLTQQPGCVEVNYLLDKFGINWVVVSIEDGMARLYELAGGVPPRGRRPPSD
jgi:hypothetical protein